MPNRSMHLAIAIPAGTLVSANKANHLNGLPYFLEVLGGALGAVGGGIWPDLADPPTTPNHRGLGHSVVPAVAVGKIVFDRVDDWQAWLRREAERMRQLQVLTPDPLLRLLYAAWEIVLRLLAGAVVGFLAAWGTHLGLDFGTVRSLPLLC